jgi:hypothetical protein
LPSRADRNADDIRDYVTGQLSDPKAVLVVDEIEDIKEGVSRELVNLACVGPLQTNVGGASAVKAVAQWMVTNRPAL